MALIKVYSQTFEDFSRSFIFSKHFCVDASEDGVGLKRLGSKEDSVAPTSLTGRTAAPANVYAIGYSRNARRTHICTVKRTQSPKMPHRSATT